MFGGPRFFRYFPRIRQVIVVWCLIRCWDYFDFFYVFCITVDQSLLFVCISFFILSFNSAIIMNFFVGFCFPLIQRIQNDSATWRAVCFIEINMDFTVRKKLGKCRRGVLKLENRQIQTPGCSLYTRGGAVPHLTWDVLHTVADLPAIVHLTLESTWVCFVHIKTLWPRPTGPKSLNYSKRLLIVRAQ